MSGLLRRHHAALMLALLTLPPVLAGCGTVKPVPTVPSVDLTRYMGDWYVIGSIPTFLERHAYNAVESYALRQDGAIQTTFRFRERSFNGPLKTMHPVGSVEPGTGRAVWRVQFIWPFKAEYRIAYLDDSYQTVIVARTKRDYVWIMARTPSIPDPVYRDLTGRVSAMGYDVKELRKVPQQWPEEKK